MTNRVPIRPTILAIGQEGFKGLVGAEDIESSRYIRTLEMPSLKMKRQKLRKFIR